MLNLFLVPEGYSAHLAHSQDTCEKIFTIDIYKNETLNSCKVKCDALEECRFIYFNIKSACRLYINCYETRNGGFKGTTFEKNSGTFHLDIYFCSELLIISYKICIANIL